MTCLDFENRLNDLLDRRQPELPKELAAHTAHCAACREMQSRLIELQKAVATWSDILPANSMTDVVLRRLQAERDAAPSGFVAQISRQPSRESHAPVHRHSSFHRGTALLSSALALVIALGIGWRISNNVSFAKRQNPAPNPMMVAVMQRPETVTPLNQAGDRQLDVLLHDARNAYAALASQAWQQVATADVLLPSSDVPSPFDRERSVDDVSESLSRPLAPLSRDLREAVDSWFQQIFNSQDPST